MSDIMEKLLKEEQNTDAKFVAAADFFMKLKNKQASAKAKNVKAKKIRSQAAADVKGAVSKGGGQSVAMKPRVRIAANPAVKGQAVSGDGRGMGGYKQLKPQAKNTQIARVKAAPVKAPKKKVKVVIASALSEQLTKEAKFSLLNMFRGAKQVGQQATAKATTKATDAVKSGVEHSKDFKAGFTADPSSSISKGIGGAFRNLRSRMSGKPVMEKIDGVTTGGGIGAAYQGAKNIFRPQSLVARERQTAKAIKDWTAANPKPTDPAKLQEWTSKYNEMIGGQRSRLNAFKSGMDANKVTGFGDTSQSILKQIRGADGKITTDSVLKGAENMGLFNPETLIGLGMSGKATIDAARAARVAAQRDRMMKMGLGGAAGLGAIALLKRPSSNNSNA
tara:strand:- start:2039 stop:3211 length:1173 start_codon:yes stop_codon:yes gene_type:complete